jgi:hypothetical protein
MVSPQHPTKPDGQVPDFSGEVHVKPATVLLVNVHVSELPVPSTA